MSKNANRPAVERVSAAHAGRSFSELLDQVEAGRSFVVYRQGRDVCVMKAPPVEGRRASECLAWLRGRPAVLLDGGFGQDLAGEVSTEPADERPSWDS